MLEIGTHFRIAKRKQDFDAETLKYINRIIKITPDHTSEQYKNSENYSRIPNFFLSYYLNGDDFLKLVEAWQKILQDRESHFIKLREDLNVEYHLYLSIKTPSMDDMPNCTLPPTFVALLRRLKITSSIDFCFLVTKI